jgi:UDP-2,4-diacetamido-2,4,6-trideoxy-beta-L-altropyranose hydrolase
MTRVVVRADAGPQIGTGHVMRCVALVEALRDRGASVEFISCGVPDRVRRELESIGVSVTAPPAAWPDARDVTTVAAAAQRGAADVRWAIVDGYHFDATYVARLRAAGLRVTWIDDLNALDRFEAEVVVNPTLGAERCVYHAAPSTRLLAGASFTLLRRSLRQPTEAPGTARIVIALGGADPASAAPEILRAAIAARLDGAEIVAIVGPSNPHVDAVRAAAAGAPDVTVLQDPAGLRELLASASLAIVAAGTMAWELALLGVPLLLLVTATNQERGAAMMREADAAEVIHAPGGLAGLSQRLDALWGNVERRRQLATRAARLIDGHGADRVARWITEGAQVDAAAMRAAAGRDALQVWRINSDPVVRENSFEPAPIPLAAHFSWFDRKLADISSRHYVWEQGEELAAVVRYDTDAERRHAELGFAVAAPFRGLGLGTRVLSESWRRACDDLGVDAVRGLVIDGNAPSVSAFRRAGFTNVGREPRHGRDCLVFERRVA